MFDPKKLEFMRRGSRTKRFHGFHLLMENPVGHHSFNVLTILTCCVPEELLCTPLLLAAVQHDLPECITGDLPAPFKRKVPGLRAAIEAEEVALLEQHGLKDWEGCLNVNERRWLKLSDSLDGAMHCLEERRLGNTTLDAIFWTFMNYVQEIMHSKEDAAFFELYLYLQQQWRACNGPRS